MYLLFVIITFIYLLINYKYKLKNDIRNNILIIISLIISFGSYISLTYIIFINTIPRFMYLKNKMNINIKNSKEEYKLNYAFSFEKNGKYLLGHNSIKQTIQEAIDYKINDVEDYGNIITENNKEFINIYIGKQRGYEDKIDADVIIENLQNKAYEENEFADDYLNDVNIELLQKELDKLWKKFKKSEKILPPFFYVDEIKKYKVLIKKDENKKYKLDKYFVEREVENV